MCLIMLEVHFKLQIQDKGIPIGWMCNDILMFQLSTTGIISSQQD